MFGIVRRLSEKPGWRIGLALLLICVGLFVGKARAEEDSVQFANKIEVGRDAIFHDVVCFFCSVNVEGTVNGDVLVFFGNVRIDGHANHDVVDFFGTVQAADDANVGQNLLSFLGSVRLGERVTVGKDLVVMFGSLHEASSATHGGDRLVFPGWIFWGPLLVIVLGVSFVVSEFRSQRRRRMLRGY